MLQLKVLSKVVSLFIEILYNLHHQLLELRSEVSQISVPEHKHQTTLGAFFSAFSDDLDIIDMSLFHDLE